MTAENGDWDQVRQSPQTAVEVGCSPRDCDETTVVHDGRLFQQLGHLAMLEEGQYRNIPGPEASES